MKITTTTAAACIAFAMSVGTVSADEQISGNSGSGTSSVSENQLPFLTDIPSAIPMTSEELGATVGEGRCGGHRWFSGERRRMELIWLHRCGRGGRR